MFCPNCGRPLNEGETCDCQRAPEQAAPTPPVYEQTPPPAYNQEPPVYGGVPTPPQYALNNAPATPAIAALRNHGSSVLMLIIAICYSVAVILSFVNSGTITQSLTDSLMMASGDITYNDMNTLSTVAGVFGMVASAPSVLMAVGLWMFHIACKSPKDGYVKSSGLTIIKVILIINAVGSILFELVLAFCCFIVGLVATTDEISVLAGVSSDMLVGIFMVLGVAFIIAAVFSVIFIVFELKALAAVRNTATTGAPDIRISTFVIAMFYIVGVCGILGALMSMSSNYSLNYSGYTGTASGNIISLISGLAGALPSFLMATLLVKYRRDITTIAMNSAVQYNAPVVNTPFNSQNYQAPMQPYYGQQSASGQQPNYSQPTSVQSGQVVCQGCGTLYDAGLDKCPNCGTFNINKPNL